LRFEIQYPSLAPHEVELQGTLAVLGRDPSCDIVINDAKCSRRHAVIEAGPSGLTVRDSGSANGVFVNDRKIDRADLNPGDVVRLGEVLVRVLPEDVPGTVVMGPDEVDVDSPPPPPPPPPSRPESLAPRSIPLPRLGAAATPAKGLPLSAPPAPVVDSGDYPTRPSKRVPVPPPPPPPPAPVARPPQPSKLPRVPPVARQPPPVRRDPALPKPPPAPSFPMSPTALVLALLWGLSFLLLGVAAFLLPERLGLQGGVRVATIVSAVLMALVCLAMAWGTGVRAPWARFAQIAISALGLPLLPFTPASVVVLIYLLRPPGSLQFSGREMSDLTSEEYEAVSHPWADAAFAGALVITVLIGVALCVVAALVVPRLLGH
jgi:hypothetical protein